MHPLAKLDHQHVWHPFTQMQDWLATEPTIISSGKGTVLTDVHGKKYLDGNSSIWTNLHGHNNTRINKAIQKQLKKIAHSSALGLANEPASLLAEKLVKAATSPDETAKLNKVFFSDDGSTAMEVALKLAHEHARRSGLAKRPKFLGLEGAYHGDTIGAVSLGHIDLFHKAYGQMLFKTDKVMSPSCYRCPYNKAKPERADARTYRKCQWECVNKVEQAFAKRSKTGEPYAGFVIEPLVQGAAGIIPQPEGWLERVAKIAQNHKTPIIADEVLTGFGRAALTTKQGKPALFACQSVGVQPDYLALAKGLTGGYLPMAATLTTQNVFNSFLGRYDEFKTFFHGHSYTGNQLGAAAGLESLAMLEETECFNQRSQLGCWMREGLQTLWELPSVGDIRQIGLIAGIELVKDWKTRKPFHLAERAGFKVCEKMAEKGVLTRPIGSVIVLIPPYSTSKKQCEAMIQALKASIKEVTGSH